MFDLFRSREKSVRYVLGFLLGLVALSMVITLVPGYSGLVGGGESNPQIVAEIGDEALTVLDIRRIVDREMRGGSIQRGMESIYIPMFVKQIVADRALAFQAKQMGFKLSEQELSKTIASLIPQLFDASGKFVGKETYGAFLAQQNISIPEFESSVEKQALATKLISLAIEGVVVTPAEVEEEFRQGNEKVKVSFFVLGPDKFRAQAAPSEQEMREFYERGKSAYKSPEKRGYLIFGIDEPTIARSFTVPDSTLQAAYMQQQERFKTPDRVEARHILLMTTDKPAAEVEKLKVKAQDLLKKLRSGGDFAQLAKDNSDDPGSSVKGGDLGWLVRGQTVPEFEKTAFSIQPGQISDVVTTQYGFHIIQVTKKEQARLRPFEEVKDEIRQDIARDQIYNRMQSLATEIRTALIRSAAEAEKIARDNGIAVARVEAAGQGDPMPEVGVSADFEDAVRNLPQGGVSSIVPIGDNKLVIAQVTAIIAPRQSTFEEMSPQIRAQLTEMRAQNLMQDKMNELEARLKENPDLAAAAKLAGVTVTTSEAVARGGQIETIGPAIQIEEAFRKPVGTMLPPLRLPSGVAFVKVIERIPADLTQLAASRAELTNSIKARRAQERREMFTDGIVNKLIKDKKVKIYEENIQKLVESYRS
ncbi:MAG: peptidylprolyl isomerase [Bryobacteraceae bacterium]|nr:peptidylprolyl isomerase [Bryobacteraceae bacterium]